jgi:DHA1 family multidrug resistance protein-like MFS transporter
MFVMALVQGIMSTSAALSWPFMPLYVVELGEPASAASLWAGIIQSPQFLLAAILAPFWGALADRVGRKAMVLRCALAMAVFTFMMGLAQNVWQLFIVTLLFGCFSGMVGASNALVAVTVPEERLGYALGWLSTAQLAGSLAGPLLGGVLADAMHDYRRVFFVTSVGGLCAVLLALVFIKENRAQRTAPSTDPAERSQRAFFRGILRARHVAPIFVVLVLAQLTSTALAPVISLYVRSLLGPGSPYVASIAGAAIAVTGVAGLVSAPLLGRRSDRSGYRSTLLISLVGSAAFTIPQAFAHTIWVFVALRSGVGLFLGGVLPSANAWIGRMTPRDQRGRMFGVTASAASLGGFFGPLIGGGVAAHFGIRAVFVVVGVLMLCSFLWTLLQTGREIPVAEGSG